MALKNLKNYHGDVARNAGIACADQLQIVTRAAVPTDDDLATGRMVYVTNTGMRIYGESGWFTIPTSVTGGSAESWDTIYSHDKTLTIDSSTLTFNLTAANDGLTLSGSAGATTGALLQFNNAGAAMDIQGTSDTWKVTKAGAATFNDSVTSPAIVAYHATANGNLTIDAKGTGTIGIGATSTGAVTITPALTAVASVTITGVTATDCLTVTDGDINLSDGSLTIVDVDEATTLSITNDTAAAVNVVDINADAIAAGGCLLHLDTTTAGMSTGKFFECFDGAAAVFSIGDDGITTIGGTAAATDALIITAGDLFLNDSDNNIIESEDGANDVLVVDNKLGAIADDKAVLRVDGGGTPAAAGSNLLRVEFTGTDTNKPTLVEVVGGGKDCMGLSVDADPTTTDVVLINSDGIIAADKGALQIVTTGAIGAGGTAMRFDITGTPNADARVLEFDLAGVTDTNEPYAIFIDAGGKKARALYIDADPVTNEVAYIHSDAVIASDKALLTLQSAGLIASGSNVFRVDVTGTPASGAIYTEFDFAGLTDTNENIGVLIDAGGKKVRALNIDADPVANDVVYVHSDAVIADNKAVLSLHSAGATAAGSSVLRIAQAGSPAAATSYTVEIDNSGATMTSNPVCVRIDNKDSTAAVIQATTSGASAPLLDLYNTNAGAVGVVVKTTHTSATPADNDVVSSVQFWGVDDTGSEEFGRIETMIVDATTATSASSMKFYVDVAGTVETALTLKTNYAVVGAGSDVGYVTSNGAYNLVLNTNEGTDSGTITIEDGANGDITLTPNGTGLVRLLAPAPTVTSKTTTATLTVAEGGIILVTTAAAWTATLPAASGNAGLWYCFKKTDAAANALTIDGNAAETIDGATTYASIDAQYDSATIVCDGTGWHIIATKLA